MGLAVFLGILGLTVLYLLLSLAERTRCRHGVQVREWDDVLETVVCAECGAVLVARLFVST